MNRSILLADCLKRTVSFYMYCTWDSKKLANALIRKVHAHAPPWKSNEHSAEPNNTNPQGVHHFSAARNCHPMAAEVRKNTCGIISAR